MRTYFFNALIIIFLTSVFSTANLRAQSCLPPDYDEVYGITSTTATIYWEDYNDNNSWDLILSLTELENPSSATPTATVSGVQETITYDAQDLLPETTYYYYIRTNCGAGSYSEWISGTFATRCADKSIPYVNNLTNYAANTTTAPDCWTTVQGSTTIVNYNAEHGNVLRLQGYTVIALPTFNQPINTLRLQFSAMTSSTSAALQVGILEDIESMSSYTAVETINFQETYVFSERSVNLNNYTGQGRYIVFRNMGSNVQYIDDVYVRIIPSCLRPENLQVSNLHANSVTVAWEEMGSATQWRTLLSTSPITNFNTQNPNTVNSPTFSTNSLTPNTAYYFYVSAVCASDNSEWSSTSFTTPCSATSLPSSESFTNNQIPSCWSRERVVGNADVTCVGYGDNPTCNPASGTAMVKWASATNGSGWQSRLVSLPLNTTNCNVLDVNFKWNHDLSNSYGADDGVQIQYSTDGINWTNSTQGMVRRYDGVHNGWTEYDILLPEAAGRPTVYVGFLFNTGVGGANCYLDEVSFRDHSGCIKPVNVSASNIGGNSATITWEEVMSATSWNIVVSETPVTNFSSLTPLTVNSTTYSAENLSPSTTYYVYVRSKCSSTSYSEWTSAMTFTTGCGSIITLPHTESFDTYGTCSDAFPPCWIRHGQPGLGTYYHEGHTCYTPSATDIAAIDGDKSLMVCTPSGCYTYTITPPLQDDIRNLAVTFFLLKSAATNNGTLEVCVMSNPNDPITFESIATVEPANAGEWTLIPVSFTGANLSGSGNRIAFRHYGQMDENYYLIDGLTIMEAPDCWGADPTLSISNITGNSATLEWIDPNAPAAQWHMKISDTPLSNMNLPANVFDQTISETRLTIDYLVGNTTYYYYIQSDCGDNTLGNWTTGNFTTLPCNCYVDIYMNDSWANTWEGAKIVMKHGTTVFAEATMSHNGTRDTARIYTCEALNIDYYFVSGNSDVDISFQIVNSLGTTIYATSGTPTAGCFTSGVPACGVSCGTAPANLTATATAEGNTLTWSAAPEALSYSVYRNNSMVANYITGLTYTDTGTGNNDCYTVTAQCIVGESGHSNESCVTGIDDRDNRNAVSIYPNPANDRFTINATFPIKRVAVVNLLGQEVIGQEGAGNHTEINVSKLPNGIYLVKIHDGQNWIVRKIIVE